MKHLSGLLLLLLGSSFFSFLAGQQFERRKPLDPDQKADHIVGQLNKRIPLTPGQMDTLTSIFQDYYTTVQANRLQKDRTALKIVNKKRDEKVKSILQNSGSYKEYLVFLEEENPSKEIERKDIPPSFSTSTLTN